MKNRLVFLVIAICIVLFCACGGDNGNDITYTPNASTEQAEQLFEANAEDDLVNLSITIAGNNDYKEVQNNYFNYLLTKITDIYNNNISEKYPLCLKVIDKCLDQPLTQAHVISGLKQLYVDIDARLTEDIKQYMLGEWIRIDNTIYKGMKVDVTFDEELGLCSRITSLPEEARESFKIDDVKWSDIQFANYKKFYMNDLVIEESVGDAYYKNSSKTTSKYKGSTATIDLEKDIIRIKYDSTSGVAVGSNQTWMKVGSDSQATYTDDTYDDEQQQEDIPEETDGDAQEYNDRVSIMDEYSISSANVEDTTRTATSEQ